jgi:hypothetical protein
MACTFTLFVAKSKRRIGRPTAIGAGRRDRKAACGMWPRCCRCRRLSTRSSERRRLTTSVQCFCRQVREPRPAWPGEILAPLALRQLEQHIGPGCVRAEPLDQPG